MGPAQRLPARGGREVFQPVRQRTRMRAAADALAVGVEQHDLNAGHAEAREHVGDLEAQPLD